MAENRERIRELFKKYYQSRRFVSELELPAKPNFHHFRFECFSNKEKFRRIRDVIRDKETLRMTIARKCPRNVFFSPLKWLDPINVRRKKDQDVADYMLSSPLFFDVDRNLLPKHTLAAARENAQKLVDYINEEYERNPGWIVFSGSEGFHIYYWKWDKIPEQHASPQKRIDVFVKSRKQILTKLRENDVIVDSSITADPWRILRVPGTLHGDTYMIAKLFDRLDDFSIEKTMLNFAHT